MKITKSQLNQIIREEYRAVRSEVNRSRKRKDLRHRTETEKEREKPYEIFPGYDDRNGGLKQLAHGIVEEEDDELDLLPFPDEDEDQEEEEEEIEEACLGNSWRDAWGRFSSEADHEVVTHGYKGDNSSRDCDHGKWKKGKSGTSHKCGRSPAGKKHPHVCKTGELREAVVKYKGSRYVSVSHIVKLMELAHRGRLNENQNSQLAQACKQAGFTTSQEAFRNLVQTINTLHKSMKGELNKPEKE